MNDIMTNVLVKSFLNDYLKNSKTVILEQSKESDEIFKIAKARGYMLKDSKDLAGFKTIYTFANKANRNKDRLPKKKLLKALPTLIGKPVDIDHDRNKVIGHYIDYRYLEKEDMVVAYGVFYKSNFDKEWEEAKKLFKKGKLTTSYEIWCPEDKYKKLSDGTYELLEMELAGGALLFREKPAFKDAEVLKLAKQNSTKKPKGLVFASKYKNDKLIKADYFKEEVEKNYNKLQEENKQKEKPVSVEKNKEKNKEKSNLEVKKEDTKKPVEVEKSELTKNKNPVNKEDNKIDNIKDKPEQQTHKIVCSNCNEEISLHQVGEYTQGTIKCPKCFAILNGQTGDMKYPPQIKDFKISCPSCRVSNWLILSRNDKEIKLKCQSCAKEYTASFKIPTATNEIAQKLSFMYISNVTCYQCGKIIPISGTSKLTNRNLTCPRCGLNFSYDINKKKQYKVLETITEIDSNKEKELNKSSEEGGNKVNSEEKKLKSSKKSKKQDEKNPKKSAEWTTKYINDLPDSAFAVIEPAYKSGKTEDKRARHLPFKNKEGKVDLPHLRNAFARVNQIKPITDSITATELRKRAKITLEKFRDKLKTVESKKDKSNKTDSKKKVKKSSENDKYPRTRLVREALKKVNKKIKDIKIAKIDELNTAKEEYRKVIRKAVKRGYDVKKNLKTAKQEFNDKENLLTTGIRKVAKQLIEAKKHIEDIKNKAEEKITFYKENAEEINKRRKIIGDYGNDISDEEILVDKIFAKAKANKENSEIKKSSLSVGKKVQDETYWKDIRKEVDDIAFGRNKK